MRRRSYLVAAAALIFVFSPALARETVLFADGRSLLIESHEASGEREWVLHLEGGTIVAPRAQITEIQLTPDDPAAPEPISAEPAAGSTGAEGVSVAGLVARLSAELDVEPQLVEAVIAVESGGDRFAVSPKGAAGLMQLMPGTARRLGVSDVFDPYQNLRAGIVYLKSLLNRYGDFGRALAAYNAGEGAVDRYHGIPPYRETTEYVIRVLRRYLAR